MLEILELLNTGRTRSIVNPEVGDGYNNDLCYL